MFEDERRFHPGVMMSRKVERWFMANVNGKEQLREDFEWFFPGRCQTDKLNKTGTHMLREAKAFATE